MGYIIARTNNSMLSSGRPSLAAAPPLCLASEAFLASEYSFSSLRDGLPPSDAIIHPALQRQSNPNSSSNGKFDF